MVVHLSTSERAERRDVRRSFCRCEAHHWSHRCHDRSAVEVLEHVTCELRRYFRYFIFKVAHALLLLLSASHARDSPRASSSTAVAHVVVLPFGSVPRKPQRTVQTARAVEQLKRPRQPCDTHTLVRPSASELQPKDVPRVCRAHCCRRLRRSRAS